jgi:bacteriocin biosynthesis cyclodehydratase domain-containing protein
MRPVLRPGTHVLRRSAGEVQVGLEHSSALVLRDTPAVRESLRLLRLAAPLADYADTSTLDLLTDHDQLVDQRDVVPLLADEVLSPPTAAALVRASGSTAAAARTSRRDARTAVRSFGHPGAPWLREGLVALLSSAGLAEHTAGAEDPSPCAVLLGVGEPDRELVDPWIRAGTAHLLVRLTEGRAVVGPFVVPGTTACLRCIDAHCTDADPAWPLLVRQYASGAARDRPDGVPEPVDPLLATLALAWAARDLASYVDGLRPSTWSATVTLHPQLASLETRSWLRHPACGCSWE